MFLQELLILKEQLDFDALVEGVLDMPKDADLVRQLEILMPRLEAAKRALGIANKLKDPADRKKHQSRVMTFMNQIRKAFNTVADALEAEIAADKGTVDWKLAA